MSPINPRVLERRRTQKRESGEKPTVTGEEGELDDFGEQWLKRWTYSHEQFLGVPDREIEVTTLSPYFAKTQFYQNKVIHSLFPNNTFEIKGGYDSRISKRGKDEHAFSFAGGKPVTVSKAVDTSNPFAQAYQEVIFSLYEGTGDMYKLIKSISGPEEDVRKRYDDTFDATDINLEHINQSPEFGLFQGMMGSEEDFDPEDPEGSIERSLQTVERRVRSINPNSDTLDFLRAGIVPVHPHLNFIPGPERNKGTFMELAIMSKSRARKAVAGNKRLERFLDKYEVFSELDNFFTTVLLYNKQEGHHVDVFDERITNQLFQITEIIRSQYQDNPQVKMIIQRSVMTVIEILRSRTSVSQVEQELLRFQQFLKNLKI